MLKLWKIWLPAEVHLIFAESADRALEILFSGVTSAKAVKWNIEEIEIKEGLAYSSYRTQQW